MFVIKLMRFSISLHSSTACIALVRTRRLFVILRRGCCACRQKSKWSNSHRRSSRREVHRLVSCPRAQVGLGHRHTGRHVVWYAVWSCCWVKSVERWTSSYCSRRSTWYTRRRSLTRRRSVVRRWTSEILQPGR